MKTAERPPSPAEVQALARAWYERQIELLAKCHGTNWPLYQEWLESYLKEQVRQRLIALGWRSKR